MMLEGTMQEDMTLHRGMQDVKDCQVDLELVEGDLGFLVDREDRDRVKSMDQGTFDYGILLHCMELEEHAHDFRYLIWNAFR